MDQRAVQEDQDLGNAREKRKGEVEVTDQEVGIEQNTGRGVEKGGIVTMLRNHRHGPHTDLTETEIVTEKGKENTAADDTNLGKKTCTRFILNYQIMYGNLFCFVKVFIKKILRPLDVFIDVYS